MHRHLSRSLWLLFVCAGLMDRLPAAAADPWTPIGPEVSSIQSLAITPAGTVYAGASELGIFRSGDAGAHWKFSIAVASVPRLQELALDPGDPRRFYVRTESGLFRSAGGALENVSPQPVGGFTTAAFAAAPSDPRRLYLFEEYGIFLETSHDRGASWQQSEPNIPGTVSVLRVDPRNAGVLYAGGEQGVLKSVDGGVTWGVPPAAGPILVQSLILDPLLPDVQYAGTTAYGIWKTVDGGASWQQVLGPAGPFDQVVALVLDPSQHRRVFAAIDRIAGTNPPPSEVWRSEDAGVTWTRVLAGSTAILSLAIDPSNPRRIFAGCEQLGVLASTDRGATWHPSHSGLRAYTVRTIAVDPHNADSLWISVPRYSSIEDAFYPGLFHTADGGKSWVSSIQSVVDFVVFDPVRPERLFAGGVSFTARSLDGGASWQEVESLNGVAVDALAIDPAGRIYVSGYMPGYPSLVAVVWKSEDGGDTWEDLTGNFVTGQPGGLEYFATTYLVIHPDRAATLFAIASDRLFRSRDGGARWLPLQAPGECPVAGPLVIDPFVTSTMYSFFSYPDCQSTLLAKSVDRGSHWQSTPSPSEGSRFMPLVVDRTRPGTLYVAGDNFLAMTDDRGATWRPLTTAGLPAGPVAVALASDPHPPGRLYAGVAQAGLFALTPRP